MDEDQRVKAIHTVDGRQMPCCEVGETDCPCICHDPEFTLAV